MGPEEGYREEQSNSNSHYDVLGVNKNASKDEIKEAYRKMARKYHPDISKEPDAKEKMDELNNAYQVLKNDKKREVYDLRGDEYQSKQGKFSVEDYNKAVNDIQNNDELNLEEKNDLIWTLYEDAFGHDAYIEEWNRVHNSNTNNSIYTNTTYTSDNYYQARNVGKQNRQSGFNPNAQSNAKPDIPGFGNEKPAQKQTSNEEWYDNGDGTYQVRTTDQYGNTRIKTVYGNQPRQQPFQQYSKRDFNPFDGFEEYAQRRYGNAPMQEAQHVQQKTQSGQKLDGKFSASEAAKVAAEGIWGAAKAGARTVGRGVNAAAEARRQSAERARQHQQAQQYEEPQEPEEVYYPPENVDHNVQAQVDNETEYRDTRKGNWTDFFRGRRAK